jgi:hypothetical protein
MEKINEVAIAYWKLEKWIKSANVDKKAAAESSLRSIKRFLDGNSIEIDDLTGDTYDSGLAVEIVFREDDDGSPYDGIAKITEMVKPIILHKGSVIQFGQAIIGNNINNKDSDKEIAITEEKHNIVEPVKEPIKSIETIKTSTTSISKKPAFNYLIALGILILIILSAINLFANLNLINKVQKSDVENKAKEIVVDNRYLEDKGTENKSNIDNMNEKISNIEKKLETKEDGVTFIKYSIKIGDSLEKICREKDIDYTENIVSIKQINYITNENKLYVGQTILLPK